MLAKNFTSSYVSVEMTGTDGRKTGSGQRPTGDRKPVSGADAAGIGVQFAATLLVFTFAGVWIDRKLGSSPWFTIVMVFVGAGGAFYSIYRKLMAGNREKPKQ